MLIKYSIFFSVGLSLLPQISIQFKAYYDINILVKTFKLIMGCSGPNKLEIYHDNYLEMIEYR